MASDLPPGVTANMIPGNRPEDAEWEAAEEWVLEMFSDSDLTADEIKQATVLGIRAVVKKRKRRGSREIERTR